MTTRPKRYTLRSPAPVWCPVLRHAVDSTRPLGDHWARAWCRAFDHVYVEDFVIHPSQPLVLAHDWSGLLVLWDYEMEAVRRRLRVPPGMVPTAVFDAVGERVLAGSEHGVAAIWQVRDGALLHWVRAHSAVIHSARFSRDGSRFVTASRDGTAKVHDAKTGATLQTLVGHDGPVYDAVILTSGEVLTLGKDGSVRRWGADGVESRELVSFATGRSRADDRHTSFTLWDRIGRLQLCRDERVLAAWSANGEVRVLDLVEDSELFHAGHTSTLVRCSDLREDGGALALTETPRGEESRALARARVVALRGPATDVRLEAARVGRLTRITFDPGGTRVMICAGENERSVGVWDARSGRRIQSLRGHDYLVSRARLSRDGRSILTSAFDGTVRRWEHAVPSDRGALARALPTVRRRHALFAVADDLRLVAVADPWVETEYASPHAAVALVDVASGRRLRGLAGTSEPGSCATFSADGGRVATGGWGGVVRVWPTEDLSASSQSLSAGGRVDALALSPDGTLVAATIREVGIRVLDVSTGRVRAQLNDPAAGPPVRARFSPDGKALAIVWHPRQVEAAIWSFDSDVPPTRLVGHGGGVVDARWHPDGQRLVTTAADGRVHYWDIESGAPITKGGGMPTEGSYARWSDDGRLLAVYGSAIWLFDDQGARYAQIKQESARVAAVQFSRGDRELHVLYHDGRSRTWPVEPTAHAQASLPGRLRPVDVRRLGLLPEEEMGRYISEWVRVQAGHMDCVRYAYWCLDRGRQEEAQTWARKAVEMRPRVGSGHLALAAAELARSAGRPMEVRQAAALGHLRRAWATGTLEAGAIDEREAYLRPLVETSAYLELRATPRPPVILDAPAER